MAEHAEALNVTEYSGTNKVKNFLRESLHPGPADERTDRLIEYSVENESDDTVTESLRSAESRNSYPDNEGFDQDLEVSSDLESGGSSSEEEYNDDNSILPNDFEDQDDQSQMRKVGEKIRLRLAAIRDDYDEKIRDCTMRIDGMAMATQWVKTGTNLFPMAN